MNLLLSSLFVLCLGQSAPGTLVVVNGDLASVTFGLPSGALYQIDYPTSLVNVWFDRQKTSPAAPLTTFTASGRGDLNGDNVLNGVDTAGFVAAVIDGPFNAEADFNGDLVLDSNDIPGFVEALLVPFPVDGAILFVEALGASTSLGDAAIDLLTDPDMDQTFTVAETQPVTAVDITLSPLGGPIGTPVTMTIAPALPPLIFDGTTTAIWSGQFEPLVGNPQPPFQISYSASQVREQSASQAIIVVGDGSATNAPDPTSFGTTGQVSGTITLSVYGHQLAKAVTFGFQISGEWRRIDTDLLGLRSLAEVPAHNFVQYIDSQDLDWYLDHLDDDSTKFRAFLLRIAENPTTLATAPTSLEVTLVALDSNGTVLDQVRVTLFRVQGDDGDPDNLVYHTSVDKPILLVTPVDLKKDDFPELSILKVIVNESSIFAIP